ncbi:hypothetical protein DPMN_066580 [Dreissena polymorpha]|uniref:Uncharacterized protein n=1 Tax=Dreissena polymorpha TaxID=45954 RepID=A0A9D3YTS3_DREPO|nr:hypothetical protein DPMN_066580 [Dreissena polymorpha]
MSDGYPTKEEDKSEDVSSDKHSDIGDEETHAKAVLAMHNQGSQSIQSAAEFRRQSPT